MSGREAGRPNMRMNQHRGPTHLKIGSQSVKPVDAHTTLPLARVGDEGGSSWKTPGVKASEPPANRSRSSQLRDRIWENVREVARRGNRRRSAMAVCTR